MTADTEEHYPTIGVSNTFVFSMKLAEEECTHPVIFKDVECINSIQRC